MPGETEVLGAGSVTGVGLTIKRLTQQVAVRLFHTNFCFPPLNHTDIVSFTVVVVIVVGRYFELLRHLLLTFCRPVAALLQSDLTGESLT